MYEIILSKNNIGRNEIIRKEGGWLYSSEDEIFGRPSFEYCPYFYSLSLLLHEWFVEANVQYSLSRVESRAKITFEKESDAILFKLTWF